MNKVFSSWAARLPKHGLRALLVVGFLAAALVFSAFSFAPPAHAATTVQANDPDTLTFIYRVGPPHSYPCVSGEQGPINPPESVINNCDWRVWLYLNDQKTGPNLCISPNTATGTLHRPWVFFWISRNGDACSS